MELCECGHTSEYHFYGSGLCSICGCSAYQPRHDPCYDPDDVADQGYSDEGHPYSGLGKVRR